MGAEKESLLMAAYHKDQAQRTTRPKLTRAEEVQTANREIAAYFESLLEPKKVVTFNDMNKQRRKSPAPKELQTSFQLRFT